MTHSHIGELAPKGNGQPNRRGFLGHVAGAAIAASAATYITPAVADPMIEMLRQHKAAVIDWGALPSKVREEIACPSICRNQDEYPTPNSKEGAVEALRFAIQESDDTWGDEMTRELMASVLRWIEAT